MYNSIDGPLDYGCMRWSVFYTAVALKMAILRQQNDCFQAEYGIAVRKFIDDKENRSTHSH